MTNDGFPRREIVLLLAGAIISVFTAFVTNFFNEKREEKRFNVQKKLELNDQIAKDLGKRLFLSYEIFRKRRDKDSTLRIAISQYKQVKEEWNLKIYSYESLLQYYYGESIHDDFKNNIYKPLVEFGKQAEYDDVDSLYYKNYVKLHNSNRRFVSKIYQLSNE